MFRYLIVRLKSVVSTTTRIWLRERAADKSSGVFFDPAGWQARNLLQHTFMTFSRQRSIVRRVRERQRENGF